MTTSMLRATGFGFQPTAGTPASTPDFFLQYAEYPTIEPVETHEIPKYERLTRAMEGDLLPGTLYYRVRLPLRVDSREFPKLLVAFAGYTFSTTHTFLFGDDPASLLTLWRYDGITGEMRQLSDLVGNTLELALDFTAGTVQATLEFLGRGVDYIGDVGATFSTYSSNKQPFRARQSVLKRAGAGFCPITGTIRFNNNVGPLYCGPSVDPTTGDPAYLYPDELQAGEAQGSFDVTARYTGHTSSILEDSEKVTERAYTLKMLDPSGTPKTLLWTFPRVAFPPGSLDSNTTNRQQRQSASGPLLNDVTTGGLATLVVTNGESAYIS